MCVCVGGGGGGGLEGGGGKGNKDASSARIPIHLNTVYLRFLAVADLLQFRLYRFSSVIRRSFFLPKHSQRSRSVL